MPMKVEPVILKFIHKNINKMIIRGEVDEQNEKRWLPHLLSEGELSCEELIPYFWRAVLTSKLVVIEHFLMYGVNCNSSDENGDTPLLWAIRLENQEMVTMLLNAGADPFIKNKNGMDAFNLAHVSHNPQIQQSIQNKYNTTRETIGNTLHELYLQVTQLGDEDDLARDLNQLATQCGQGSAKRINSFNTNNQRVLHQSSYFQPEKEYKNSSSTSNNQNKSI